VRVPSIALTRLIEKEHTWLPVATRQLPTEPPCRRWFAASSRRRSLWSLSTFDNFPLTAMARRHQSQSGLPHVLGIGFKLTDILLTTIFYCEFPSTRTELSLSFNPPILLDLLFFFS
jgi:hypothetical protein